MASNNKPNSNSKDRNDCLVIDVKKLTQENISSKKAATKTFCSKDIANMYNISKRGARKKIARFLDRGEAELVEYKRVVDNKGTYIRPMYRFVK